MRVCVIGGGLAGAECALKLSDLGVFVDVFEMRPNVSTEAHRTDYFAELVCSNSFKSVESHTPHGILKKEMSILGSNLLKIAERCRIPGGKALTVDRCEFSKAVTELVGHRPNIRVIREEVKNLGQVLDRYDFVCVATGPLTSNSLSEDLKNRFGEEFLSFYDAASPIVAGDSIKYELGFWGSRYSDQEDYFNIPLDKDMYYKFVEELRISSIYEPHLESEKKVRTFNGCRPIEDIAREGVESLRFSQFSPKGLKTKAFAVIQLRPENLFNSAFSLVGFQTRLRRQEQEKLLRMLPALSDCEILRYGFMHRNTYINSPRLLNTNLSFRRDRRIFFAGQITGVEGYVESMATGLFTAYVIASGGHCKPLPNNSMIGSLVHYVSNYRGDDFQPMNANFGLIEVYMDNQVKDKRQKRIFVGELCIQAITDWLKDYSESSRVYLDLGVC
ncbi:MAG: methylenetetrahydrofolate--tRNA-(uracil(54)-C(5))-methyltransferase (FADH(2)-oxidizing) TrmFO [Deltaproteobacteria bacterium]|nr:methylenetetrahydrofolate--tRNA-(uracil(54)-C(5))-methyltransferase (FADH(2)-oxidizing) TrmFO [Deltaproteobacteria bacterium]